MVKELHERRECPRKSLKQPAHEELRMGYKEKDTSKPSLTLMLISRGIVRSP